MRRARLVLVVVVAATGCGWLGRRAAAPEAPPPQAAVAPAPPPTIAMSEPAPTPGVPAVSEPVARPEPAASPTQFETSVRPILERRCQPCHWPGGKMYERIPFDDPWAVASHREGVLRRLKEPEENAAIVRWLDSRP